MDYSELESFVYNMIAQQLETETDNKLVDRFYKDICESKPKYLWDLGRTVLTKDEVQAYLNSTSVTNPTH